MTKRRRRFLVIAGAATVVAAATVCFVGLRRPSFGHAWCSVGAVMGGNTRFCSVAVKDTNLGRAEPAFLYGSKHGEMLPELLDLRVASPFGATISGWAAHVGIRLDREITLVRTSVGTGVPGARNETLYVAVESAGAPAEALRAAVETRFAAEIADALERRRPEFIAEEARRSAAIEVLRPKRLRTGSR